MQDAEMAEPAGLPGTEQLGRGLAARQCGTLAWPGSRRAATRGVPCSRSARQLHEAAHRFLGYRYQG